MNIYDLQSYKWDINIFIDTLMDKMPWISQMYNKATLRKELCDTRLDLECLKRENLGILYTTSAEKPILNVILAYVSSIASGLGIEIPLKILPDEINQHSTPMTKITFKIRKRYQDQDYDNVTLIPPLLVVTNLMFLIYKIARFNSREFFHLREIKLRPTMEQILNSNYPQISAVNEILTDFATRYKAISFQLNQYNHYHITQFRYDSMDKYLKEKHGWIYDTEKISSDEITHYYDQRIDYIGNYIFCIICKYIYQEHDYPIPDIVGKIALTNSFKSLKQGNIRVQNVLFDSLRFAEIVNIVRDTSMVYRSIINKKAENADEFLCMFNLAVNLTVDVLSKVNGLNNYITFEKVRDVLYDVLFPNDITEDQKFTESETDLCLTKSPTLTIKAKEDNFKERIKVSDLLLMMHMMKQESAKK